MEELAELLSQTLRSAQNTFYGKYRAKVVDNNDPEKLGRLRLQIPAILGDKTSEWALPAFSNGGYQDMGSFSLPPLDANVWAEFEGGNSSRPIWTGTFFTKEMTSPQEAQDKSPDAHIFKSLAGHLIEISDQEGEEKIDIKHQNGVEIALEANENLSLTSPNLGSLTFDAEQSKINLSDQNGNSLILDSTGITLQDCNGNSIVLSSSGIQLETSGEITLKGMAVNLGGSGGEPVIKGQSFVNLLMTHTHPAPAGVTGPPIPQGELSTLSMKVKST